MHDMGTVEPRSELRRWLSRIAVGGGVMLIVLLLAGWVSYRYVPSWYRPAYVAIEDEQGARDELGAAFTALSRGMGQGEPFDFTVKQDELNRWLVARHRIWPESRRWIPEQIEDPMVLFTSGEILVAGTWMGPGPRTVINLRLRPAIQDGRLSVRLVSVRGGVLPVPLAFIRRPIARLEQERAERDERPLLPDGKSLADAMDGAPVQADIPWSQPKGKFRIEALTVTDGELRVRLCPFDRRVARHPHGL